MTKGTTFFKNLDALRFFAFLGVFISHTFQITDNYANTVNVTDIIFSVLSFSYLGVPFFFTLSSFLITYRLLEEYKQNNKIRLLHFYAKRGLRIWPIYFLLLLICFFIIPFLFSLLHFTIPTLPDILPFLFFWSNFYMIDHGVNFISALIILWSVVIEEQFYIFWGLIIKYLKKYIVIIICVCLIVSVIYCYYYLSVLHGKPMNLKIHTFYAIPDFCFGGLIAFICHSKKKVFNFLKKLSTLFYGGIYFVLIVFNVLQNFEIIHFDIIVNDVFNAVCYALILFDQTFNDKRFFNAGEFKPLSYLGKISYGLYIYHLLVFSIMIKAVHYFTTIQNVYISFLQATLTLIATIITAHVSYRYFESFFLKVKDKL